MAVEKEEKEKDLELLVEKVPDLFIVDIVSDLDLEMGDSEPVFTFPAFLSIILALLPPSLTTSRMSAHQRSHQIFPYNMAPSHTLPVYLSTVIISGIFFYQQHQLFNLFYPIHPHSPAENLFYATAILNEIFYIYFALYPVVYAIVLRIEEGEWPSSLRVWASERMRRGEREREGERSERQDLGFLAALRRLPDYTFYGDLGKKERMPDMEDGEGVTE